MLRRGKPRREAKTNIPLWAASSKELVSLPTRLFVLRQCLSVSPANAGEGRRNKAALSVSVFASFCGFCVLAICITCVASPPNCRLLCGQGRPSALPRAPLSCSMKLFLLLCPQWSWEDAAQRSPPCLLVNNLQEEWQHFNTFKLAASIRLLWPFGCFLLSVWDTRALSLRGWLRLCR